MTSQGATSVGGPRFLRAAAVLAIFCISNALEARTFRRPAFVQNDFASQVLSDAPSLVPSDAPSMVPSDVPSLVPSTVPSKVAVVPSPSAVLSDYPSLVPFSFDTASESDYPSLVPSDLPSLVPSTVPTPIQDPFGEITIVDSVALETSTDAFMDATTIQTFQDVCENDFLPWYMTRIQEATYSNIECTVLRQTTRSDSAGRLRGRKLASEEHESIIQLYTTSTKILLRVRSVVDLPEGVEYAEIVRRTFLRYILQFQGLLADRTLHFEDVGGPPEVDGIVADRDTNDESSGVPKVVIIGSALLGAGLAASLAVLYVQSQKKKRQSITSPQDSTDHSIMLLFDDRMEKQDKEDDSISHPYLPPTPFGAGVPMEIGPQSWVEPDDDLSQGTPENKGSDSSPLHSMNHPPKSGLAAESRAAEIFDSMTGGGNQTRKYAPRQATGTLRLLDIESGESNDEHSKPTVSSNRSVPTKSSANTRRTNGSQSDGSSTLHGLKIVGTMSGYQDNDYYQTLKGEMPKSSNSYNAVSEFSGRRNELRVETGVSTSSKYDKSNEKRNSYATGSVSSRPREESIITDRVAAIAQVFNDMEQSFDRAAKEAAEMFNPRSTSSGRLSSADKNSSSVENADNVLQDLGRLEDEWDGQLESKLSASATTPRRANSEKVRKTPRQRSDRKDMV